MQIELVDHLASAIEEQWEQQPELSFLDALKNSFKKFGVHGFSKIKRQKEKEVTRKHNRLLWKYMLEFYRWPKMLLTIALSLGLFLLFQIVNGITWILVPYFIGLILIGLFYSICSKSKN